MENISTFTKRRLQAEVINPIYEEIVKALGEDKAQSILGSAIRKDAMAAKKEFCLTEPGSITGLRSFIDLFEFWIEEHALEIQNHEESDAYFSFDVTHCQYVETFCDMGIANIDRLLFCSRDGVFCDKV
jgi:hypothetical protein